jgi:hypothetical protein
MKRWVRTVYPLIHTNTRNQMLKKFDFFVQFDKEPGSYEHNWLLNDLVARRLKKKDTSNATKQPNRSLGRKKSAKNTV